LSGGSIQAELDEDNSNGETNNHAVIIPGMRYNAILLVLFMLVFVCGATWVSIYNFPPFYQRLDTYLQDYRVRIHRVFYPPEEILFVPPEQVETIVQATMGALTPPTAPANTETTAPPLAPTNNPVPTSTELAQPTAVLDVIQTPIPIPTQQPTPIPQVYALSGVRNEVETRNNCGPATLAMALSFWGWQGDQTTVQAVLRPYEYVDDKNVMPAEMQNYVHGYTNLKAAVRVGGDPEMLKSLIAAGFPVIIEKGHTTTGWIGHYILLTGYDDTQAHFLSQDSLIVDPDVPVAYDGLTSWWRHFNYLYIVIYPAEREAELFTVLGPHADAGYNLQASAEKARQEVDALTGRDRFFALYNLGSSLTGLGATAQAVQIFDQAFADVYPDIGKEDRPWRVLWYRTDAYQAYFEAGRYQDVIRLADATLLAIGNPVLEETFYWRGKARDASGDESGAIQDYEAAVRLNPGSTPALEELQRLQGKAP